MSEKRFILALDQGTTSSRAIIFDHSGNIQCITRKEFKQIFPHAGWVEHDPVEIWSSQASVAMEAMAKTGIKPSEIAAIGITNQRETSVVWDRETGKPIYNAIVWQDRRTSEFCDELKEKQLSETIKLKTGLVIDPYFSATKIRWILQNVKGAAAKAEKGQLCFGTVDSWLIWKLTNGKSHFTDISNASRTMLFNIRTHKWDNELLDLMGIPISMMPEVKGSSEFYAETSTESFGCSIPISGIAGDQQAALFGQLCLEKGMAKATYGTGCFLMLNTGLSPVNSKNNLLTTIAWQINGKTTYALEGSVFIAGAAIQWLRDGLGIIKKANETEALARSLKDNEGVYFVPALTGLGAPHWDPYARGTLFGLTRGSNKAHIVRAALESIAYQVYDVTAAMSADANEQVKELRVDGGAVENDFLMQFQSDILNTKVIRPTVLETTALGVAYLAGLAIGFWKNEDEIHMQWKSDKVFTPTLPKEKSQELLAQWNKAVTLTRNWSANS
jgi:glycerol kinase